MVRIAEKAHENEFSVFLGQYSLKSALLCKEAISGKKGTSKRICLLWIDMPLKLKVNFMLQTL